MIERPMMTSRATGQRPPSKSLVSREWMEAREEEVEVSEKTDEIIQSRKELRGDLFQP
jgi:hypothetical protein